LTGSERNEVGDRCSRVVPKYGLKLVRVAAGRNLFVSVNQARKVSQIKNVELNGPRENVEEILTGLFYYRLGMDESGIWGLVRLRVRGVSC